MAFMESAAQVRQEVGDQFVLDSDVSRETPLLHLRCPSARFPFDTIRVALVADLLPIEQPLSMSRCIINGMNYSSIHVVYVCISITRTPQTAWYVRPSQCSTKCNASK